jgi:hypothetical protein
MNTGPVKTIRLCSFAFSGWGCASLAVSLAVSGAMKVTCCVCFSPLLFGSTSSLILLCSFLVVVAATVLGFGVWSKPNGHRPLLASLLSNVGVAALSPGGAGIVELGILAGLLLASLTLPSTFSRYLTGTGMPQGREGDSPTRMSRNGRANRDCRPSPASESAPSSSARLPSPSWTAADSTSVP